MSARIGAWSVALLATLQAEHDGIGFTYGS